METPIFRYHPDPFATDAFERSDDPVACDSCAQTTHVFYSGPFWAVKEPNALCPTCIASGRAAQKFDGEFQDECSLEEGVDDPAKLDELIHRTPGFRSWQQEYWRAHCGDYCAYLGETGADELTARGILDEVLADPTLDDNARAFIKESVKYGHVVSHLFQCLVCDKHLVWSDLS